MKFLVLEYRLAYNDNNRSYLWKDWLQEKLPSGDLIISGDVMEHLSLEDGLKLLKKINESDARYHVMAHDESATNKDISLGQMRSLNMCIAPFNISAPDKIFLINNKKYGLWKINN